MLPSTSKNQVPEKSESTMEKLSETKNAPADFPNSPNENKDICEHTSQFIASRSSGSDSICSSTSGSSIQTQVSNQHFFNRTL